MDAQECCGGKGAVMLRIGVCDDIEEHRKCVGRMLEEYLEEKGPVFQSMVFENGQALLYEVEDGTVFDLLLLDIEMPGQDGMELAGKIKELLPEALVIFISSHEKYVYDSFRVQPFRFIPKSRIEQMLFPALGDALEELGRRETRVYLAENGQGIEKIPIKSIVYIWHREKYAYIEKADGERTKIRKTLKKIFAELPQETFVWLDRGYLCNLAHITRVKGESVTLSTGERLQVSRDRSGELKDRVRQYWTKL